MGDMKIRKLDDWVIATHRGRAGRAGRSLEEELRVLLTEAALREQHEFARRVAAPRERVREECGLFPDRTELVRGDRETRGLSSSMSSLRGLSRNGDLREGDC